jgi:hypothetical protein
MQDPLHYPHGTKWMAPGPLGQCHPLPDDANIRLELARAAHNHRVVYERYNFDWDPEPGSAGHLINQRIRRGAELQGRQVLRLAEALEEVEGQIQAEAAAAAAGQQRQAGAQPVATLADAPAAAGGGFRWPWQQQREQQQPAGNASISSSSGGRAAPFASLSMAASADGGLWLPGPLSSCSLGLGVGRASKAVLGTMARAARRAPCLTVNKGRPRLSRPRGGSSSSSSSSTAPAAAAAGSSRGSTGSSRLAAGSSSSRQG